MKYILITIGALLVALIIAFLVILLINRKKKKKLKWWMNTLLIIFLTSGNVISFTLIYFAFNYKATENAKSYLKNDEKVKVIENKSYYQFDNVNGDEVAIMFYGGAKVEEASYAQLCHQIAEQGIDVYLFRFPLYFPLININAADKVSYSNKYHHLYMMGHSLGGTVASLYLSNNTNLYEGIIFLASYPNKKLDDSLKCLSIYGSVDTVLNKKNYSKNIDYFPKDYQEVIIEGGNHSNFGDYGLQRGDSVSSISKDQQIEMTTSLITTFINID